MVVLILAFIENMTIIQQNRHGSINMGSDRIMMIFTTIQSDYQAAIVIKN